MKNLLAHFTLLIHHTNKNFYFQVFINPEMKVINNRKISYPEACASVKGYSADVPRFSEIEIKGKKNRFIRTESGTVLESSRFCAA